MNRERVFPPLAVNKKGELSLRRGHPWVYGEELISGVPEGFPNGGIVDVVSQSGKYLGSGFYSEKSKISVRILSDNA
ncbi:MAG: rRNA large subunit methyltransferase I, partial [Clostridia bacterium]|nr:rRNA large subunit methyltransferase I [Clostridia bacterium]